MASTTNRQIRKGTTSRGKLSFAGRRHRRLLGQHFLRDQRVASRIVRETVSSNNGTVVEIGPGRGALTGMLAAEAQQLVLIELDPILAKNLRTRFATLSHVRVICEDARLIDVGALQETKERPYTLVGNLPYSSAMPIVRRSLEIKHPPDVSVVMVQREVAQSMCGLPGKRSLLSFTIGYYADAAIRFTVPPRAFSPPPEIYSSVVLLKRRASPPIGIDSADRFFNLLRAGFAAPRKTVANSLSIGLKLDSHVAISLLLKAGLSHKKRPGVLVMDDWVALYRVWKICCHLHKPESRE